MIPAGTKLGPYEVVAPIGHGGMGDVYRARDVRLRRQVAIKTLAPQMVADPIVRERFDREARAVAALSHPNILAIYDVGIEAGIPYLAVELLDGETLRSRLGAGPLPLPATLDYAVQIGRGLAAAHDRGVLHRDLKPENIFVTRDGQIKLLDFGLATEPPREAADEATHLVATEHGALLGTAGYMSPEQARGEPVDARSDIFSFGCVLYEMLSGRRAFTGDTRVETLHAVLKEQPAELASVRRDVPPALDRLVRRCLEKTREGRFQTARDLVFALETASDPPVSPSAPPFARPRASRRATILAVIALGGGLGAWWTVARHQPQEPSHTAPPADARRLLAVLPFENISRSGEGYFAAGMTEEVTNQISKLSGLRIVSASAVAKFKDAHRDLPAMVRELGIGSVVTGTVREEGSRVRVNVELIDARSGQVVWSEQYDRDGVDVFGAQSDIALRIGEALSASVTLDEKARIGKRPTSSVAAYELFVRARKPPGKTPEERLQASIDLLRQAVALDPNFADAYSEIANRSYFQAAYGDLSAFSRGLDAANRALVIDPELASAHHALAMNLHQLGHLQDALASHRKAIALNPSYVGGLDDLSFSEATAGLYDQALKHARQAHELGPNIGGNYYHIGVPLLYLNDDARTERVLTAATTRYPDVRRLQILLAFLDLRRGQPQPAAERIRALAERAPDDIEVLLTRAEILTFAGTSDAPEIVRSLMDRAADGMFHNAPYPVKLAHAYYLLRSGADAAAKKIMDDLVAANRQSILAGADWPIVFVQNAAIHALRHEVREALDDLDRGYAAGWRDGRTLAIDPLLAPVRSEPRFQQVLSRIDADVAVMRARADYSGLR